MSAVSNIEEQDPRQIVLHVNGLQFQGIAMGPSTGQLVLFLHGFPQFADAWEKVMRPIADAGYHAVAVDQRGYSKGARPPAVSDYGTDWLVSDVLGFATELGASRFHLVAHDWGGFVAWKLAAQHSDRVLSVSVIATAHVDAFLEAITNDPDQAAKSRYIQFFRMPEGAAEAFFLANEAERLRGVYQGKVSEAKIQANVQRLSDEGALTAVLNWYRAMDLEERIGRIAVPTLYVWGDGDIALGEVAALQTASYIDAQYHFERVDGGSHWLLEEMPERLALLILGQLSLQR